MITWVRQSHASGVTQLFYECLLLQNSSLLGCPCCNAEVLTWYAFFVLQRLFRKVEMQAYLDVSWFITILIYLCRGYNPVTKYQGHPYVANCFLRIFRTFSNWDWTSRGCELARAGGGMSKKVTVFDGSVFVGLLVYPYPMNASMGMVYLPTWNSHKNQPFIIHVGKFTSPMDAMGYVLGTKTPIVST